MINNQADLILLRTVIMLITTVKTVIHLFVIVALTAFLGAR